MSHFKMIEYYFDSVTCSMSTIPRQNPVNLQRESLYLTKCRPQEADVELAVESTPYKMHTPSPRFGEGLSRKVAGNFSTLSVTVTLNRYVGSLVHLNFNILYVTLTLSIFKGSIVSLNLNTLSVTFTQTVIPG
jgi:hypothetical protein